MFRRFGTFVFGFVLGGVSVYVSLHYHVVRSESGLHWMPKLQSTFGQTYVDVRGFEVDDWNRHRMLAAAITRANKAELFRGAAVQPMQNAVNDFLDQMNSVR